MRGHTAYEYVSCAEREREREREKEGERERITKRDSTQAHHKKGELSEVVALAGGLLSALLEKPTTIR